MQQWIHRRRGQMHPYLQFLVMLLLVTAGFFVWMSMMGCDSCQNNDATKEYHSSPLSKKSTAPAPKLRGRLVGYVTSAQGGDWVRRSIFIDEESASAPDRATLVWTPPEGASNFRWDAGHEPDNPDGPPPFVWSNTSFDAEHDFDFQMPPVPPGETQTQVSETLVTTYEGGDASREILFTALTQGSNDYTDAVLTAGDAPAALREAAVEAAEDIQIWQTEHWFDTKGVELTTEKCQSWIDLLTSDRIFFAVQAPVVPREVVTYSKSLSLVMGEQTPGTLAVQSGGAVGEVYRAEMVSRDARTTFLNRKLPARENTAWVAVGLPEDAPDCPAGLDEPADSWSFLTSLAFDLRTLPDGGAGSYISTYLCYEGETVPLADSVMGLMARRAGIDMVSYQGEGITCLGPQIIQFREAPSWQLESSSFKTITDTQPVTFHHLLFTTSATVNLDYEIESTLGLDWGLYFGSDTAPDLNQPLADPFALSGFHDLWLVSEALAEETPAGPYSVQLTLTNVADATDSQIASDIFWVGDWVAPPTGPANPFLPLIVR